MNNPLPYRDGVGIMLLNKDNFVWVGKRIDMKAEAWQMPQGGMDAGEAPLQTAMRELKEETGIGNARLLKEGKEWYYYDLPADIIPKIWGGKFRGQRQKWFAMRFDGHDDEVNIATKEPEFSHWQWVAMDDLPDMIVPFKRELYQRLVSDFKDVIAAPESL